MNNFWKADKKALLDDFAAEVKNKNYQKIIYSMWQSIMKGNNAAYFHIEKVPGSKFILTGFSPNGKQCYHEYFYIGDKSFGDYLNKVYGRPRLTYNEMEAEDVITTTNLNFSPNTNINTSSTTWTVDTTTTCPLEYNTTTSYPSNVIWSGGGSSLEDYVKEIVKDYEKNKEKEEKMDTSNMFNFDFGPVSGNWFRMSPYGLATQTSNNGWVSYDVKTGDLIKVDIINFDMSKLIYKMPVPFAAIQPGDIVMHAKRPVFVRSINQDGTISVIDYTNASISNILPVKSPFGFNFFTKICSLVDFSNIGANSDNPFGNMLPLMFLADGSADKETLMMMAMMNNGNGMDFINNPMMLYFLMNGKDKSNDMLPFLMMTMSGNSCFGNGSPAKKTSDQ